MSRRRPALAACDRCGADTHFRAADPRADVRLCRPCFAERGRHSCLGCDEQRLPVNQALCRRCERAQGPRPDTRYAVLVQADAFDDGHDLSEPHRYERELDAEEDLGPWKEAA